MIPPAMTTTKRLEVRLEHLAIAFGLFSTILQPAAASPPSRENPTHWTTVENRMTDGRWAPAYAAYADGRHALIAGGFSYGTDRCVASADIFDERSGKFHRCRGRMGTPRDFAQAALLPDGNILICGGFNDVLGSLWNAEIFNRLSETFTPAPSLMVEPRELFQATILLDGRVLLTGGLNLGVRHTVASAEIYDPGTGAFTRTGSMSADRFGHAACRLSDGRVFVVGGTSLKLGKNGYGRTLSTAELYNPNTGAFTAAGNLNEARDRPTASLLPDGRVMVIGGQGPDGKVVTTAEAWDPLSRSFTIVEGPSTGVRMAHTAVSLGDGNIIAAGGWDATAKATSASATLYDCRDSAFEPLPMLPFASHDAAAVLFGDGAVLIAGGKSVTTTGEASSVDEGALIELAP